jgi:hypothetical protein
MSLLLSASQYRSESAIEQLPRRDVCLPNARDARRSKAISRAKNRVTFRRRWYGDIARARFRPNQFLRAIYTPSPHQTLSLKKAVRSDELIPQGQEQKRPTRFCKFSCARARKKRE